MKQPINNGKSMISESLAAIRQRIAEAAYQFARSPESIQLLAVSKTRSVADIVAAIKNGQNHFGENYLQESLQKIQALQDYALEWHFLGPLQSNKTRLIAENFDWVQSVNQLKHAQRLNVQRPQHLPPLNICVQVNISETSAKSGIYLNELRPLVHAILELPRLRLRGLMTLPEPSSNFEQQRIPFQKLYNAYQQLQQETGLTLDTLSMGMTDDMVAAIAEGATLVRVGTGIFGPRVTTV